MAKYAQDVKDKAIEMLKAGKSLAAIKQELGPNPKAVERYCKKAGIDMKALMAKNKEAGIQKPETNTQKPAAKK